MAYSFNGTSKIISLTSGVTAFDVKDMYSSWKVWLADSDNAKYEQAFSVVGGDPTSGANFIYPYFFLENGWRVRPDEAHHQLQVSGALLVAGGGNPYLPTIGSYNVQIIADVPVRAEGVATGGGGGASAADVANAVWAKPLPGAFSSGTAGHKLGNSSSASNAMFSGQAASGAAFSLTFPGAASATDDFYMPGLLVITGGTGAGQSRRIESYAGATKVATIATAWAVEPDSTSMFSVLPWASVRVSEMDSGPANTVATAARDAVWHAPTASYVDAGTMGLIMGAVGAGADPWTTVLPGAYADGTAGHKLGGLQTAVSGSAAISTVADGFILNAGIETGTYVDTQSQVGPNHIIDDVSNDIDIVYTFNVGVDGTPVSCLFIANLQSANDSLVVQAWDYVGGMWASIGILPGSGSSATATHEYSMVNTHVGSGADSGRVQIRLAGGSSNPRLDVTFATVSFSVNSSTAQYSAIALGGSTSSINFPPSAVPVDDYYKPGLLMLVSGTGAGQSRRIDGYSGTSRIATVATAWEVAPDATTHFAVLPWASVRVSDIDPGPAADIGAGVWDRPLAAHTTSGTFGWFVQKTLTVAKFLGLR